MDEKKAAHTCIRAALPLFKGLVYARTMGPELGLLEDSGDHRQSRQTRIVRGDQTPERIQLGEKESTSRHLYSTQKGIAS